MEQVRHFDLQSTRPRLLVVPANPKRPEHFLRPAQDPLFATTGQLSAMRLVSNTSFLPEDLLHCSVLLESARFAKCHWSELPAVCVGGHFELVSDRHYAVWKAGECPEYGTLVVNAGAQEVELWVHSAQPPEGMVRHNRHDVGELLVQTFSVLTWHIDLRDAGFIVAPMIWRSGACVRFRASESDDPVVGCISAHMDPGACVRVLV